MITQTINPATEIPIQSYDLLKPEIVQQKIELGHQAYKNWRNIAFEERALLMLQLKSLLNQQKKELAHLMATEMGKPITAGIMEIEKCALVCEYFAQNAEIFLKSREITTENQKAKVCYRPLGIILAIMPWNFPFWQVFRFAAPTLMAGNAGILKHASISLGTGVKIEQLFLEAGFPHALFQHLVVDNNGAQKIIEHDYVSAVTLTGSERAGREIASHAGRFLKKSVLELGGSDPYLILDDADLDWAAQSIVTARLSNSGQVCIAPKRIIALKSIEKELTEKIIQNMAHFKMGDPLDPKTTMGPLAREDLRTSLHKQVEKSIKQGAKLLRGGIIPKDKGFYYPPTLLSNVKPGMVAFEEELFGPVIVIITVENEQEAIAFANKTQFGLGAAIFSKNLKKAELIARQDIEAGVCFVNSAVASDPRLPFGGIKQSGYGRELSQEGILEFVNVKTIAISDL